MMAFKKCKVIKCTRDHHARGYCHKHYKQFKRNGDLTDTLEMVYDILKGECTLEDCGEKLFIHGLCLDHYNEVVEKGYIDAIKDGDTCRIKECTAPLHKNGLCAGHYEDFTLIYECGSEIRQSIGERLRTFDRRKVPLDGIDPSDESYKVRQRLDHDRVAELASSIATIGLLNPVNLLETDDQYILVAGFYRYAAHEFLTSRGYEEFAEIDAKVIPQGAMSEEDLIKLSMDENFKRNFVTRLEAALKAEQLRLRYSPTRVAELMGTNRDNIKKYHSIINKAARPVMEALHNDQISLKLAYTLLKLDKPRQKEWLHQVLEQNMSERQLREALKEKREDRFKKNFQKSLKDPDFPLKKAGRGTYVLDNAAIEGVANARKLYRFLQENGIELRVRE